MPEHTKQNDDGNLNNNNNNKRSYRFVTNTQTLHLNCHYHRKRQTGSITISSDPFLFLFQRHIQNFPPQQFLIEIKLHFCSFYFCYFLLYFHFPLVLTTTTMPPIESIQPSTVKPLVRFGESPHHVTLSGPDGLTYSATYGNAVDKDNTMSMAYDLYYKGSLIDSLSFVARGGLEGEHDPIQQKAIIEADGNTISFTDLYKKVTCVGRGLCELGLNSADRALVYVPAESRANHNLHLHWLLTCYGLWAYGMSLVVVTTEGQLADAIAETKTRVIITAAESLSLCRDVALHSQVEDPQFVLIGGGAAPNNFGHPVSTVDALAEIGDRCQQEHQRTMFLPEPEHVALIVYSSHTPGSGVVLTHGNLFAAATATKPRLIAMATASTNDVAIDGKSLHAVVLEPFSHIIPFVLASACLIAGGSVTFGLNEAVKSGAFVPTVIACSNVTYTATRELGGAKAPILHYNSVEDTLRSDVKVDDEVPFWYSPIAASGVGLMRVAHSHDVTLMPGAELKLRFLADGEVSPTCTPTIANSCEAKHPCLGEVMLRGPFVSKGYYTNNKDVGELDRSMLRDGWLPTGDVAELKPNGDIVIIGRMRTSLSM